MLRRISQKHCFPKPSSSDFDFYIVRPKGYKDLLFATRVVVYRTIDDAYRSYTKSPMWLNDWLIKGKDRKVTVYGGNLKSSLFYEKTWAGYSDNSMFIVNAKIDELGQVNITPVETTTISKLKEQYG